jgi:ribose 5-phosphate isomerase RpiB
MVGASDAVIAHKNEIQRSLPARHYDMTRAKDDHDRQFTDVADAIAQILKKFQDGTSPSPTANAT